MNNPLIIIGASARAAAQSAVRAGFSPWCLDHFADADLALACPARHAARYPHDLTELLQDAPSVPWIYTGALENHPEAVTRLAAERPLWGNDAQTLSSIRDPMQVADALRRSGFPTPRLADSHEGLPTDGGWLVKRRRSAGGFHVRRWDGVLHHERLETHYFQEFISGLPCSAVFVAAAGQAALLGATRQLIGESWAGATGFQYVGSVGPLALEARDVDSLRRLGAMLSREFGLRGLFGVDFILNPYGVWPIEVNPRYTASVETVERCTGLHALHWHAAACRDTSLLSSTLQPLVDATWHFGKAILYAPAHADVTYAHCRHLLALNVGRPWPDIADVPSPGSRLSPGAPVATVFAEARSDREVRNKLCERVASMRRLLFPGTDVGIEYSGTIHDSEAAP